LALRSLVYAALGSAMILSAAVPAYAQHEDRRNEQAHRDFRADNRYRAEGEHHDRDRRRGDWDRSYAAPPVVVAPPQYGYYAPPPVAYSAPGFSIGINIP